MGRERRQTDRQRWGGGRDRERNGQTDRGERQTDRQTDRQTETQTETDRDKDRDRQTDRLTDRETGWGWRQSRRNRDMGERERVVRKPLT